MDGFGIFELVSLLMECLCMALLTPVCDGNEGVGFLTIVLYGIN